MSLGRQLPCALRCTSVYREFAQGVRLVFYNDDSDILLLQQLSEIPRDFKPFFMGGRCAGTHMLAPRCVRGLFRR